MPDVRKTALPRLHRRGPIEANSLSIPARDRHCLFHVFIDVAPLKLECRGKTGQAASPLPRLHRRGPIEAASTEEAEATSLTLPRLHRRGPIEAISYLGLPTTYLAPLPRLHRRGPIEATIGWSVRSMGPAALPRLHRR